MNCSKAQAKRFRAKQCYVLKDYMCLNPQLTYTACFVASTESRTCLLQNTKKAWHPSTLKNQERVWKAEQAAAEEQRRIAELQRERAQEREREELNKLARQNSDKGGDNRLSWMYDVRELYQTNVIHAVVFVCPKSCYCNVNEFCPLTD